MAGAERLTVAITGPTGDIGKALVRVLERSRGVATIRGLARRPFDPASEGWKKFEYRRGDVLDRDALEDLVAGADVVVHLAFIIMGSDDDSRRVNLEGSRNVFQAAVAAGAKRLVYASSVAAYGFRDDHPPVLTEDVGPRGSDHYYSAQKAELEGLLAGVVRDTSTATYVFRPCIVAGPGALVLVETIPKALRRAPGSLIVLPDPGIPVQFVHEDDVATAMRAAILGKGSPGAYNLAGPGQVSVGEIARALGWRAVRVPEGTLSALARVVSRLPFLPAKVRWIDAIRAPMLMDTTRARRELGWRPKHDAAETLRQTVDAARAQGLL